MPQCLHMPPHFCTHRSTSIHAYGVPAHTSAQFDNLLTRACAPKAGANRGVTSVHMLETPIAPRRLYRSWRWMCVTWWRAAGANAAGLTLGASAGPEDPRLPDLYTKVHWRKCPEGRLELTRAAFFCAYLALALVSLSRPQPSAQRAGHEMLYGCSAALHKERLERETCTGTPP